MCVSVCLPVSFGLQDGVLCETAISDCEVGANSAKSSLSQLGVDEEHKPLFPVPPLLVVCETTEEEKGIRSTPSRLCSVGSGERGGRESILYSATGIND